MSEAGTSPTAKSPVDLLCRAQGVTAGVEPAAQGVVVRVSGVKRPGRGGRWKFRLFDDEGKECQATIANPSVFEDESVREGSVVRVMNSAFQKMGDPAVPTVIVLRMEKVARFAAGARVDCLANGVEGNAVGGRGGKWKPGTVLDVWYGESGSHPPYNVRLDGESETRQVLSDDSSCIRPERTKKQAGEWRLLGKKFFSKKSS